MKSPFDSSTKPIFRPFAWALANSHFFVADEAGIGAVEALFAECAPSPAGTVRVVGLFAGPIPSAALTGPFTVWEQEIGRVKERVEKLLAASGMSTHLYIAGSEDLIAAVTKGAVKAGLAPGSISADRRGPTHRTAQCVHCKTIQTGVSHRAYKCPGCARVVVVRDHYARRIGAYQALMLEPGDPNIADLLTKAFE